MRTLTATVHTELRLQPFEPRHAAAIAGWVDTQRALLWLAPSMPPPLTAEKVIRWRRPGQDALVMTHRGDPEPIGYGELNRMRREPDHLWLGHVVVRPDRRGTGAGKALVHGLLDRAFAHLYARRISLVVFPDNVAAVRCYTRCGFVITREEYHRFGDVGPRHRLLRLEIEAPPL